MSSRSRSLGILSAAFAAMLLFAGCASDVHPESRLTDTNPATTADVVDDTATEDAAATPGGTHNWNPDGAPAEDGAATTDATVKRGLGAGDGSGANGLAADGSGSLPNSASLAGLDGGQFVADLEMVHFRYDSADIDDSWKPVLDKDADWMKTNPTVSVQIEGHCDERGTEEYNVSLGQRRADVVREYLVSKGVDGNKLSTISYGKLRPITTGASEDDHAMNRRAMFLVYTPETAPAVASN